MKVKVASKCRQWEKVRRDKLNQSFSELCKLLPNHDPSLNLSKIDILQRATSYIEELQQKLKNVLTEEGVKRAEREEIKVLYDRVKKLVDRNEQLCNLLKDARIKIPADYNKTKDYKEHLAWSNKITPEKAKRLAEKEAQKENETRSGNVVKKRKVKVAKKTSIAAKHQKKIKPLIKGKNTKVINVQLSNVVPVVTQKNVAKPTSQPCFILTSNPVIGLPKCCGNNTVVTNTSSLTAPKMTAIVTPPSSVISKVNPPLSSLGPGTLIFPNGNIVPILPQSAVLPAPAILTNPAPIILKPPSKSATLIVVTTKNNKSTTTITNSVSITKPGVTSTSNLTASTSTRVLPTIRPKARGITKTTQINKVPIPALTSRYDRLSEASCEKKHQEKASPKKRKAVDAEDGKNKRAKTDTVNSQPRNAISSRPNRVGSQNAVSSNVTSSQSVITSQCNLVNSQVNVVGSHTNVVSSQTTPNTSHNVISSEISVSSSLTAVTSSQSIVINSQPNLISPHTNVTRSEKPDTKVTSSEKTGSCIDKKSPEGAVMENLLSNKENVPSRSKETLVAGSQITVTLTNDKTTACGDKVQTIKGDTHPDANIVNTDLNVINKNNNTLNKTPIANEATNMINEAKIQEINAQAKGVDEINKVEEINKPPEEQPALQSSNVLNTIEEAKVSKEKQVQITVPQEKQVQTTVPQEKKLATNSSLTSCVDSTNNAVVTASETSTTKTVIASHTDSEINEKNLELNLNHELSNDIFSSLQVPIGGQNPESTSPTAAFLLAFPLVSSLTGVKVTEVIEEENSDSRHGTPTLLQIGTMDTTKTTHTESLTPNLLNLDNFSFFSGKDMCSNFYSSFDSSAYGVTSSCNVSKDSKVCEKKENPAKAKSAEEVKLPKENLVHTTVHANLATSSMYPQQNKADMPVNPYRQNTATHSKPAPYETSMANMHYEARPKVPTTSIISSSKDMAASYTTASTRKNAEGVQCSNSYNTVTSTVISMTQCNTYNPFSDFSKPSTVHSYATFSKPYSDPLYTNSTSYSYPQPNNNFEQVYYPTKSMTSKPNNYSYPDSYNVDCKTKRDSNNQRPNVNYYNHVKSSKEKPKVKPPMQPKAPINWMTTPDFRPQTSEYLVPFGKDMDYNSNPLYSSNSFASTTHTTYFNSSNMYPAPEFQNVDNRKFDSSLPIISTTNSMQRGEFEENQFSWSPTKLPQFLEAPHSFVSSTLPTLVGDLALGTAQNNYIEQKEQRDQNKQKETNRRSKAHPAYDTQSNFLSVSQLVENKPDMNGSRTVNRRNSASRSTKSNSHKAKHSHKSEGKDIEGNFEVKLDMEKPKQHQQNYVQNGNTNWMVDCNKNRNHKNPQSSYSAEALIGHQDQVDNSGLKQRFRQQQNYPVNKTIPIPTFLSENIVPYFPPVEIPQDNNFIQANTNYQSNSLSFSTSVQNNVYSTGTYISTGATITSSYLQNSALIPEYNHEYAISEAPSVVSDKIVDSKHCRNEIKQPSRDQQVANDCSANNNFMKKTKHKHANDANLPGIVDFGFLSMPNTINSPILPDDFHSHSNFLPPHTPSQLYPCKNPLYTKQTEMNSSSLLPLPPVPTSRTTSHHFEGSPAVSNVSSSLTSFNLSAIFPEINKGPVPLPGLYTEPSRNKSYNFQRNYLGNSVQVTLSNKSSSSTNYVNSVATSYAPSN